MADKRVSRLITAKGPGYEITAEAIAEVRAVLPAGFRLYRGTDLGMSASRALAEPFNAIPVLPDRARYRGEPIAVLVGPSWAEVDYLTDEVPQSPGEPPDPESNPFWHDSGSTSADSDARHGAPSEVPAKASLVAKDVGEAGDTRDAAAVAAPDTLDPSAQTDTERNGETEPTDTTGVTPHVAEGTYATALQLHIADEALWARAETVRKGAHVTLPTQWPAVVRSSVARVLKVNARSVALEAQPTAGSRDAALWMPAYLAVVATAVARIEKTTVTVALRGDQRYLTGGRSPAKIVWSSRLDGEGVLMTNRVTIDVDLGAYPSLTEETGRRVRRALGSIYQVPELEYAISQYTSPALPMGAMEGVGTAQVAFAREVHYNRLAELAQEDPVLWRRRHLRDDWPVLHELLGSVADESDYHRRYAANELVRKRRIQLPRNSKALRGIGCAVAEQISGMTGDRELGAVTVRLDPGGNARLFCTLPTPTLRLITAWRQLVAQELSLEIESVTVDTSYNTDQYDSGPRLFSRGASVVPRAIQSVCQTIQKQRFREPLPIQVRRTIRTSRAARTPAHALRSAGAATVEAVLLPASMEIDIKSVTLSVYAGRILDRGSAEAELRRGIYQALNWTLYEAVQDPTDIGRYRTTFRGKPPRIRIVFGAAERRDGPTGIGELPFLTVPAALTSAVSQASGLYLDTLPVRPATLLQMLQEE
ncbi:MAG: molybdopterin cofactor-binding domain-containing protein [Alkalispirochaeta sp.]